MDDSTAQLVKVFNALPRKELSILKKPNEWYFDVRFIQIEPNPYHAFYLMLPSGIGLFRYVEPLPYGRKAVDGLIYFPETGCDAAPEVARSIMCEFITMGCSPWKLMTPDIVLRTAVNEELRRIGVTSSFQVVDSPFNIRLIADEVFDQQFYNLLQNAGFTRAHCAQLIIPESICFPTTVEAVSPFMIGTSDWDIATSYVRHVMDARPITELSDSPTVIANMVKEIKSLQDKVEIVPEAVIRVQADNGNWEAALDYGLRLRSGLGCSRDRSLSRVYLFKALHAQAPDIFKATVHAALIEWYTNVQKDGVLKNRYVCSAAHHTQEAIRCCNRADPDRKYYCNQVISYASTLIEVHKRAKTLEQVDILYADVAQANKERNKQVQEERKKQAQKRRKTPNRYRCAAVDCKIQADSGKMLSRCSGQCDFDKKPSYCSKECQKADWKNHKPFCRPGAECSVIDDGTVDGPGIGTNAIQVPVTYADGSTMYFSSSTMEPKALKEMAEAMVKSTIDSARNLPNGLQMDFVDTVI